MGARDTILYVPIHRGGNTILIKQRVPCIHLYIVYTYKVGGAYIKGVSTQINIQDVTRLRTSATATDVGVWQMAGSTFRHSPICSCSTLKYNGIFILFMGPDRRDLPMNNRSSRGICNEQFDIKKKYDFILYG